MHAHRACEVLTWPYFVCLALRVGRGPRFGGASLLSFHWPNSVMSFPRPNLASVLSIDWLARLIHTGNGTGRYFTLTSYASVRFSTLLSVDLYVSVVVFYIYIYICFLLAFFTRWRITVVQPAPVPSSTVIFIRRSFPFFGTAGCCVLLGARRQRPARHWRRMGTRDILWSHGNGVA